MDDMSIETSMTVTGGVELSCLTTVIWNCLRSIWGAAQTSVYGCQI